MPDIPFRTIEISDPRFEHEGLRYVTVKTPNLKGRGDLTVWLPDPELLLKKPVPLVILLHGVYGSHWAWSLKGGAHRTADRLIRENRIRPMILAMPSDGLWGDGSGYLPHNGLDFERWILDDVPNAVAALVSPEMAENFKNTTCIAGLSMGGYGALRLAASYPERFRAVCGLSSITESDQLSQFVEEPLHQYVQIDPVTESVAQLMRQNRDRLPAIRFDCGTEDQLIEANRTLHKTLLEWQIPHQYQENPGGHEWPYWEKHIADALRFFDQQF
ncbi:alpha/beta hydrolase [Larkinella rosea]|uniref:Esterase family protein n=1 Tax=Larkinella rosea TaxID=2025312 RepID=A0A3P1BPB6_9BACT|nr:alpha/beta hydrolase-fold protein [Larkinella rosea]RRB02676.1 esterase family protein [Larkinella rosea]